MLGVPVVNFPAVQPVSVDALPLPQGAATEATIASLAEVIGRLEETTILLARTVNALQSILGPAQHTSGSLQAILNGGSTAVSTCTYLSRFGSSSAYLSPYEVFFTHANDLNDISWNTGTRANVSVT